MFGLACGRYVFLALFVLFYSATFLGESPIAEFFGTEIVSSWLQALLSVGFLLSLFAVNIVVSDIIPRTWAFLSPETLLRFVKQPASIFLFILSPVTLVACRFVKLTLPETTFAPFSDPKTQLIEIFGDTTEN